MGQGQDDQGGATSDCGSDSPMSARMLLPPEIEVVCAGADGELTRQGSTQTFLRCLVLFSFCYMFPFKTDFFHNLALP